MLRKRSANIHERAKFTLNHQNVAIMKEIKDQSSRFKVFHELMRNKVEHILLISIPYEAWIMEKDCRLSEQIINEYRGLNLSQPPTTELGIVLF